MRNGLRSMFEEAPLYINILDKCYRVDSISHSYEKLFGNDHCNIEAEIKAHLVGDKKPSSFEIEKVIFNDPATIVFWADGTKTVVKCGEEDVYDYQTGLLMCIAKKAFGNKGKFNDILREWIPEEEEEEDDGFSIRELFGIPKTYTFECQLSPETRDSFEKLARSGFNPNLSGRIFGGKTDE